MKWYKMKWKKLKEIWIILRLIDIHFFHLFLLYSPLHLILLSNYFSCYWWRKFLYITFYGRFLNIFDSFQFIELALFLTKNYYHMIIHFKSSLIYPLNMNVIILMKSLEMTHTRRMRGRSGKWKWQQLNEK